MQTEKPIILLVFNFRKKQLILTYSDYSTENIRGDEAIKMLHELDFEESDPQSCI